VVVIGIDAFRPDRLKSQGGTGEVAPQVERFLADATLFTRAYTPIAQTEPAWRSLLTARWPHTTGVRYALTADSRLRLQPTFPQTFAQAGWRTVFATDCSRFHWEGPASGFDTRLQPPRAFDAYRIRPDGVVEMGDAAHSAIVREKDRGAFDGRRWWVDRPRADGGVLRTCEGECEGADAYALEAWLDAVQGLTPEGGWRKVAGHVDAPRESKPSGTLRPPQPLLRLRSGQSAGPAHPQPRGG
jgi:hypothetical protein